MKIKIKKKAKSSKAKMTLILGEDNLSWFPDNVFEKQPEMLLGAFLN